jgi:2-iminobutanoate/2-iminopropanoate deaminase
MPNRKVIEIGAVEYTNNPLPLALTIGNMLYTSRIRGRDPETGKIATTMAKEVELIFDSLNEILRQAGGSLDDLALMKLFVNDYDHEREFDGHWTKLFPDADDRPARYTYAMDDGRPLAGGATVMGEFIAVLDWPAV